MLVLVRQNYIFGVYANTYNFTSVVLNGCVIELFCGVVCVVTLPFWHFFWCRGFCHRTESDVFLFLLKAVNKKHRQLGWHIDLTKFRFRRSTFSYGYLENAAKTKGKQTDTNKIKHLLNYIQSPNLEDWRWDKTALKMHERYSFTI